MKERHHSGCITTHAPASERGAWLQSQCSQQERVSSPPARPHRAGCWPQRCSRPSSPPRARLPLRLHPHGRWPCCPMSGGAGKRWVERSECAVALLGYGWVGNWGRARRPQCSFKSGPRIQDSQRPRACQPAAPVSGMRRTCYDEHCHCSTLKPLQRACFGMPLCCNPGRAKTARQSRVHGASGSRRARDKSIGLATG